MEKTKTKNRCLVTCLMLIAMLMTSIGVKAQNVTIGPKNGSIITGQAGGNVDDSGIKRGMGSMWRHEQLPLTMATSDIALVTAAGEMGDPSCAIDKYTINGEERLIIGAGQTQTFIVVSLPKGYRITGYRLVLQPNIYGNGIQLHQGKQSWDIGNDDRMCFYETPAWESPSPYGGSHHSTTLDCNNAITQAKASDGTTTMQNNNDENRAKEFVIARNATQNAETEEWDMGNQLYFFFARATSQYAVSIKSFEIRFTAQGTFEAEAVPIKSGEATDYVTSPFTTSKMDVGNVVLKNGIYTYDYTEVRDLIAYTHLYQDNAVSGGKPAHMNGDKNIYPVEVDGKALYAFGNDTYFIEPPTEISTSSGVSGQPIGFRVVGAKFDCQWGTETAATTKQVPTRCAITCRSNSVQGRDPNTGASYAMFPGELVQDGSRVFYLNPSLMFTTEEFYWEMDELGNIGTGLDTDFPRYLSCYGEGATRQLSLSSSASGNAARWNLRRADDGSLYYYSDGGNSYRLYAQRFQEGTPYHARGLVTRNENHPSGAVWVTSSVSNNQTINIPAFTPGAYTLTVYGTDTTNPVKTKTVNSANDKEAFTVTDLNNDAVMFTISGLASGKQALVTVTLMLEALNPYIDQMDIVCHDIPEQEGGERNLEITQTFTSNDFSVSGGKFVFYVPDDYSDVPLEFTFSELYSKYGDNTYYDDVDYMRMNGNARYSYVTSNYFKKVSGNQVDNIDGFPVNGGLYDTQKYNPDERYETKVFTSTAGNVRYKFSNAEDLTASSNTGEEGKFLIEYPFSVTKYLNNYSDPDGSTETGAFIPCILKANPQTGDGYQKSDVYYIFTADETRYNIAPTTEMQHRSYAFYRMDIELVARTFKPKFTWTNVYDKTCYAGKDSNGQEIDAEDSMWGLKLDVRTDDNQELQGYLTYQEIIDNILGRGQEGDENYIPTILDPANTNGPKSMSQILYVDGTPLKAMLNSKDKKLEDLKSLLAPNALVFLPVNTTSSLDNVVYKTPGGAYLAGNDIILKDRQPFFTPYKITVNSANKATYSREITIEGYGLDTNATVMLPFALSVTEDEGKHTNIDDRFAFTVNKMVTNQQIDLASGTVNYYGKTYFQPIKNKKFTEAHVPYVIRVETRDDTVPDGSTISFIATQYGAEIEPMPTPATTPTGNDNGPICTGKLIKGETTLAKYKGISADDSYVFYDFTNYASYSGAKFDRASSENVFYFWENKYVDLHTLYYDSSHEDDWRYLYSYPFRGVYTYKASTQTFSSKMMSGFVIAYDLDNMESMGIATDLNEVGAKTDLMIRSDKGVLTISASRDQDVTIRSINGMTVKAVNINAGDTKTVGLPSGVYLVNNIKITVK